MLVNVFVKPIVLNRPRKAAVTIQDKYPKYRNWATG